MNHIVFSTGGDWDSTQLTNNGQELAALRMSVRLTAGRDEDGDPCQGGIDAGGEITAVIEPQSSPGQEMPVFPGVLELRFPEHRLAIENTHPAFAFEFTRVEMDGRDVTQHIVDLQMEIDAPNNVATAYATFYKPHWFSSDEVATFTLIG